MAQSNAGDITLGVLGPWLGCMNPKHTGGSSGGSQGFRGRPRKEGVHPCVAAGLCYPKDSSGTGCPSLQEDRVPWIQGRMAWVSPPCAAAGKGTNTALGPLWGSGREKKPISEALRAFLGRGCSVRLGLASVALWGGTWLPWLCGTAVSPCSSRALPAVFPWC